MRKGDLQRSTTGDSSMDDSRLKHGPAWDDVGVGVVVLIVAAIIGWQIAVIPTNAIYAQVGPKVIPWMATALLAVPGRAADVAGFARRLAA